MVNVFMDVATRLDAMEDAVLASQSRLESELKRLAATVEGSATGAATTSVQ